MRGGVPLRLFISYSSNGDASLGTLDDHLKPLERDRVIDVWHDRKIEAGEEWDAAIADKLDSADDIVLVVSRHFLASDFCHEREMQRALTRHDASEARVIPIILNACNWERAPLARLQGLPDQAKLVEPFRNREAAWTRVRKVIEKVDVGGGQDQVDRDQVARSRSYPCFTRPLSSTL